MLNYSFCYTKILLSEYFCLPISSFIKRFITHFILPKCGKIIRDIEYLARGKKETSRMLHRFLPLSFISLNTNISDVFDHVRPQSIDSYPLHLHRYRDPCNLWDNSDGIKRIASSFEHWRTKFEFFVSISINDTFK